MLGSDFELFMANENGEFVPEVHLNLPDKGLHPIPLEDDLGHAGFIHRDNVSVEMCSLVASSAQEFVESVSRTLEAGKEFVSSRLAGVRLSTKTTVLLPEWVRDHEHAVEIGCDADSVSDSTNLCSVERARLCAETLGDHRYAGGHVHISYVRDIFPPWVAAMLCDLFIGLPLKYTIDPLRAPHYGLASLHRETQYPNGDVGVEYRALDSKWVHTADTLREVALGAGVVQSILQANDMDAVQALMRVRASFEDSTLLISVSDEVRDAAVVDSFTIADKYVQTVLREGL